MPIKDAEIVEVIVSNTSTQKFNFPDVPNLRGKKITSIEVFKLDDVSKAPSGKNVVNNNAIKKGFLTLYIKGREKIKEMPLQALVPSNRNGVVRKTDLFDLDYQKSYISFADTLDLVINEVVLIVFIYEDAQPKK